MGTSNEFTYCIGRPYAHMPQAVEVYALRIQILHGTLGDAKNMRDRIRQTTGESSWRIYTLTELPDQSR
jgi:hypothetical protein